MRKRITAQGETDALLADPELLPALERSMEDLEAGRSYSQDEVEEMLSTGEIERFCSHQRKRTVA